MKNASITFKSLLTEAYSILFSAVDSDNFQEIADNASHQLHAAVIIADALHHIVAVSQDIRSYYHQKEIRDINWIHLIHDGFAPSVITNNNEFFADEHIGKTLVIHKERQTTSQKFCTMCDLFNKNGRPILKIAVCTERSMTIEEKRLFLSLCFSVHLAFYQLNMNSGLDARGKFLLHLLTNGRSTDGGFFQDGTFPSTGSFELVCFDISELGSHNLSFLPILANILEMPSILSVTDNDFHVLLVDKNADVYPIYKQLDEFAQANHFPIFISPHFSDLRATPENYTIVRQVTTLGKHFKRIEGMHHTEEFSLFMFFENLDKSKGPKFLMHPDSDILFKYDEEKNTDYALTVYCYLLHNCEAAPSAEALFIHRNTLDKRLRKIETLILGQWNDVQYQTIMIRCLYKGLKKLHKLPYYAPTIKWPLVF